MTNIGKLVRIESHNRRKENIQIVKKILSESNTSYFFTSRELARKTGLSSRMVGMVMKFLHKQGHVEKVSSRAWKKKVKRLKSLEE